MSIQTEEGKNDSLFRIEDLQCLNEWLKKQSHLPPVSGITYCFPYQF